MTLVRPEDWRPQGIDDLENRAWEALRETDRSVCVTAGAGAGKTEFLAQKGTYLLQTGLCPYPKRILAISFKRDAARNLAERVARRCPPEQARRFDSMTFDAFTKQLVDQFRSAIPQAFKPPADYEVSFPTRDQLDDFLRRRGAIGISRDRLEQGIAKAALPFDQQNIPDRWRELLEAFWQEQYEAGDHAQLTFAMINRLVEYMLRRNEQIKRVLRSTYPFVFLDEFQDTTYPQFDLLITAFDPERTICTAVGDDKQKIMRWAGAMANAFEEFTNRFNARCIALLSNWRSHDDLVAIQHVIAQRIDPEVERAVARNEREVDGDVAAIWVAPDRETEARALADWVAGQIEGGGLAAHRIAILVRMLANRIEDELAPAFAERGIVLRNVARNVGGIAIQDLLAEDLTALLLPLLRVGSSRRNAEAWSQIQDRMRILDAVDEADEVAQQRLSQRMGDIVRALRDRMRNHEPNDNEAADLVPFAIDLIGEGRIRQASSSYQREADYERVRDGFVELLKESTSDVGNWSDVLDRFEGRDQVPLMTIHKSKGLEFHTIIFFGLDTRSWRSLRPEQDEELSNFFVAFTRAEQRAFFTCCDGRGGRIDWLEDLLGPAVPRRALV